jgi:uncharacterized protein (DUF58 family)
MAKPFRISDLQTSRSGLYLSAMLFGGATAGLYAAVQFWLRLGNAELFFGTAIGSAMLGAAGVALLVPRAIRAARAKGWRLPRTSPITWHGVVFVCLVLLVAGAALYSGNNLIYLILSAMLAATLMSGLVSRIDLAGLHLTLGLPDHIFAGRPSLARVGLQNLKLLIPSFAIRVQASDPEEGFALQSVYFPVVAANESVTASVEVVFARRGKYRGAGVDLVTRFPFGLVERRAKLELKDRMIAYPNVQLTSEAERALNALKRTAMNRTVGDSHDLYRVRPAVASDGARFIHWKASAGSPELWVREFTREERLSVRLVLDRRASSADGFETAVAACAAVAWKLAEESADITLATDERSIVCRAGEHIYELLGYLALVESVPPGGPAPSLSRDRESEYVFVATGPEPSTSAQLIRAAQI